MRRFYVRIFILLLIVFIHFIKTEAQILQSNLDIEKSEELLKTLFKSIQKEKSETKRIENNDEILKIFRSILNDKRTFSFSFDSLIQFSKVHSPDSVLSIYSWMLAVKNGYKHFGFVQYRSKKGELILYELNDKSNDIVNPEKQLLSDENWYGVIYYKILPASSKKNKQYTLFGFDANNMLSNKKILEIVSIDADNRLVFGNPVFKIKKKILNRIIFEYSARSVMMLKYDDRYEMIVHDHLSPLKPLYTGQFMFYVPDLSYDGWKFEKGIWEFVSDIDLRNPKK